MHRLFNDRVRPYILVDVKTNSEESSCAKKLFLYEFLLNMLSYMNYIHIHSDRNAFNPLLMSLPAMMFKSERSIIVMTIESITVGINVRNNKYIIIVNFTSALNSWYLSDMKRRLSRARFQRASNKHLNFSDYIIHV